MFDRRIADVLLTLPPSLFFAGTLRGKTHSGRFPAVGAFASALLVGLMSAGSFSTAAQDKPEGKPVTPTASPSPSPPQSQLGTELDGPILVNTDLITLTVTVTDTYGRYVSGLNQKAFVILDEKQPQEIHLL